MHTQSLKNWVTCRGTSVPFLTLNYSLVCGRSVEREVGREAAESCSTTFCYGLLTVSRLWRGRGISFHQECPPPPLIAFVVLLADAVVGTVLLQLLLFYYI